MNTQTRRQQRPSTEPKVIKDYSMNIRVPTELLPFIDQEARNEGLTRAAVLRRLLMRTYGGPR